MRFQVGQKVGDYEFLGVVEATATGVTYRVQNLLADRHELLKVLPPDLQEDQERIDRFLREAKIHARLHHPNIAAFYNATRVDGQLVMTSELVEGTSLEQRIGSGSLPVEQAAKYFEQALSALSYAHREGVVHRDIKPGHLIITPDDSVKITGFGLAKKATDPQLTQPGIVMGSVHYMSPEQVKGSTELDRRSDIYSLGVVLYEAVTGQKPFDSKSQFEVFLAHVNQEPAPPSSVHAGIPPALDQIILTAMAKQPASRFQTAEEFRDSLGKLHGVLRDPVGAPDAAEAQRREPGAVGAQDAAPSDPVTPLEPAAITEQPAAQAEPLGGVELPTVGLATVEAAAVEPGAVEPGAGAEPSWRANPFESQQHVRDAWPAPHEPPPYEPSPHQPALHEPPLQEPPPYEPSEAASQQQPAAVSFHDQFAATSPEPFTTASPEQHTTAPFAVGPYEPPPATPHSEPPAPANWYSEPTAGEVRPALEQQQDPPGWSYSDDGHAGRLYSDEARSGAEGAAAGSSSSWDSAGGGYEEAGSAAWPAADAGWGQAQEESLDASAARGANDTWPQAEEAEELRGVPLLLRPSGAAGAQRYSPAAPVQPREPDESAASWFGEQAFAGWTSKDILAVGALTFVIVAAVFFALLTFLNR